MKTKGKHRISFGFVNPDVVKLTYLSRPVPSFPLKGIVKDIKNWLEQDELDYSYQDNIFLASKTKGLSLLDDIKRKSR